MRSQPEPGVSRTQLDDGSVLFTFGGSTNAAESGAAPQVTMDTLPQQPVHLTKNVLQGMKVVQLRNLAKERGTKASNFGKLRKDELIDLLLNESDV